MKEALHCTWCIVAKLQAQMAQPIRAYIVDAECRIYSLTAPQQSRWPVDSLQQEAEDGTALQFCNIVLWFSVYHAVAACLTPSLEVAS